MCNKQNSWSLQNYRSLTMANAVAFIFLSLLVDISAGLRATTSRYDDTALQQQTASACFQRNTPKDKQPHVELQCPSRHIIRILSTSYGFTTDSFCGLKESDCQFAPRQEPQPIRECTGKPSCYVSLPSDAPDLPHCLRTANVYQIKFVCVPEKSLLEIGSQSHFEALTGYIMTPHYPRTYSPNLLLSSRILAPYTHRINLYVLDMHLTKNNDGSCDDTLYVGDGVSTVTLCSKHTQMLLYKSVTSYMDVTFQSSDSRAEKGFMLYYEMVRMREDTSTFPTTSPSSTTPTFRRQTSAKISLPPFRRPSSRTQPSPSSSDSDEWNSQLSQAQGKGQDKSSDNDLPVVAIIGGTLGSLIAVVIILLVIVFIKRWRHQTKEQNPKSLDSSFSIHSHFTRNVLLPTPPGKDNPYYDNISALKNSISRESTSSSCSEHYTEVV